MLPRINIVYRLRNYGSIGIDKEITAKKEP
jgi:hypothetical protein